MNMKERINEWLPSERYNGLHEYINTVIGTLAVDGGLGWMAYVHCGIIFLGFLRATIFDFAHHCNIAWSSWVGSSDESGSWC